MALYHARMQREYTAILKKYNKFKVRLDRNRENGAFWNLPAKTRSALMKRLVRLRRRLEWLFKQLSRTVIGWTVPCS